MLAINADSLAIADRYDVSQRELSRATLRLNKLDSKLNAYESSRVQGLALWLSLRWGELVTVLQFRRLYGANKSFCYRCARLAYHGRESIREQK